ncbi:MAG TPA: hypothetical protein VF406_06665 [Thermodesulfobacteriota bacterium]
MGLSACAGSDNGVWSGASGANDAEPAPAVVQGVWSIPTASGVEGATCDLPSTIVPAETRLHAFASCLGGEPVLLGDPETDLPTPVLGLPVTQSGDGKRYVVGPVFYLCGPSMFGYVSGEGEVSGETIRGHLDIVDTDDLNDPDSSTREERHYIQGRVENGQLLLEEYQIEVKEPIGEEPAVCTLTPPLAFEPIDLDEAPAL